MKNIKIVTMILFLTFSLAYFVNATDENNLFLSVTLDYDKGDISIKNTELIESSETINKKQEEGNYILRVYSFKEEMLYETKFDINLLILSAPLKEWFDDEGNQIYFPNETDKIGMEIEHTSMVIFIPYFRTMRTLKLFDSKDSLILSQEISEYAVCNLNAVCDVKETTELCPEDCSNVSEIKQISFWQRIISWLKSLFS